MIKFLSSHKIMAFMSEREDGSMKIIKDSDLNLANRASFFNKIGIDEHRVVAAEIVHGSKAAIVNDTSTKVIAGADALVTKAKHVILSITIADCIPVYAYDPKNEIIAVVHCGWRSIVGGIIKNTIAAIIELGGDKKELVAALGPGINACHFEIKEDSLEEFSAYLEFIIRRDNKIFVDLKGIIIKQLKQAGISLSKIENNNECTMENGKYFSYRRDKPKMVEAMVAVIGFNTDISEKSKLL